MKVGASTARLTDTLARRPDEPPAYRPRLSPPTRRAWRPPNGGDFGHVDAVPGTTLTSTKLESIAIHPLTDKRGSNDLVSVVPSIVLEIL